MIERRTILFRGRVQGVGFRATAMHLAADLPVCGTVENLFDGGVRLIVEGESMTIDALIGRMREHFGSFVRTVEQHTSPAAGIPGRGVRILS